MLYLVSMDPEAPDPGEYADSYTSQVDAVQACVSRAKSDRSGGVYYVHEVRTKPVFKASTQQVVNTEVMP